MYSSDLVDVAVEVFGGYCPAIPPSDQPSGAAGIAQDVIFPQGAVRTRGGLENYFAVNSPIQAGTSINGLKSYLTPTLGKRLLAWDSVGNFYEESVQGTLRSLYFRPYPNLFYQSTTLFGREYQTFFNSSGGFDIPRQFDDTYWDRVSHSGPGKSPTAVDSATAGNIAAGLHQVSLAFINRQGFISQAAPPSNWTAGGAKQVDLTNIATGPSNIVARLLIFTPVITAPATTGNFFSLPTGSSQLSAAAVMLINDNVTVTKTIDFNDVVLQAGFSANYLFTQRELGESAFAIGYNSRIAWLGERNKQTNFVNMGFDGGFGVTPVAMNTGAGSPSVAVNAGSGDAWINPNNVFASDGVAATCLLASADNSQYLNATGYGFAIPATAQIAGILVTARVKGSLANVVSDFSVALLKNGAIAGVEHSNGNLWTAAFANQSYGGSADLWGEAWTPADINNANFGVAYSAQNQDGSFARTASIDYLSITVYYNTVPTAGTPLGWTQGAAFAGGDSALANNLTADWGDAFYIAGDGATAKRGEINQSAYQDYLKVPIIARNTSYRVRARVARNNTLAQGTLHINLQSTSGAFTTAGLSLQASDVGLAYAEFDALLTGPLVSPPTDLLIQVYVDGTPTNNGAFIVDSIEPYPENSPFNYSTARFSHAFNPESYDATTGQVQIRPNDGQQLRAAFPIRNNLYLAKDHYLCYVADDGTNEPSSWTVNEVSATIGICGSNACDWTEEWAVFAERSGLYICWGSDPVKITPEIQNDASGLGRVSWASINWQYGHTIWVRIDKANKMILVGAPVNGATTPNIVFMMDYRWLDNAQDIANSPLVTYSGFTGKVLAHGRGRRWATWLITANSMTFAERSDGTAQPFFGNGAGNGKIYQQLDCATQPSDDGVAVDSQYQTYGLPSGVEEQAYQLGAHRKLLGYLKFRAVGAGNLMLAIGTAARSTLLRNYSLSTSPAGDGERPLNLHGERFYITAHTLAVGAWFQLERLTACVRKEANIVVRGMSS